MSETDKLEPSMKIGNIEIGIMHRKYYHDALILRDGNHDVELNVEDYNRIGYAILSLGSQIKVDKRDD